MRLLDPIRSIPLGQRIAIGFIGALVLIALGFGTSLYMYIRHGADQNRVERAQAVIATTNTLLRAMQDVETGIRGYVITSDSAFLQPYIKAAPTVNVHFSELKSYFTENELPVRPVFDSLTHHINGKLYVSAQIATMMSQGNASVVDIRRKLDYNKAYMDGIRVDVDQLIAYQNISLDKDNEQANRSYRLTLLVIFCLSIITFTVLLALYRMLENELNRREENERQLRAYEVKLHEQIRQLQTSNEDLERFAFVASHDLQEPLRKIQSFANLIEERSAQTLDADNKVFLSKIVGAAGRMSSLIKDLLYFSRISNQKDTFNRVRLTDTIQGVLEDQEMRIRELNASIDVEPLPVVNAVASQMTHLFGNLITNALKFVKANERPVIRIWSESVTGENYPELLPDKSYYCIQVSDNGIGFDEKYLDHIFQVFQRLHGKSAYEGMGIGLAICKRVVAHHNGFITAKSSLGQGATFLILLPAD